MNDKQTNHNNNYEYVYVEDDHFLREMWQDHAAEKNIRLLCLENTRDFHRYENQISKQNTHIFLDHNLGEDELTGKEFAKILKKKGYQKITMATCESEDAFFDTPWLKIQGKKCPF